MTEFLPPHRVNSQVGFVEVGTGALRLKAVDNPQMPSIDLELY